MAETLDQEKGCPQPVGMVVDDDAMVRETVVAIMAELCDEVYEAADGIEGLEVLEHHPDISVVITDIAMPRLDGIGFVRQARREHPDLKVLFVSGLQHPPASEEFLPKPFPRRALVSALQHLLSGPLPRHAV
jgi:two-component system, cell cycle sensor histidine kinase and response regulator CckA